VSNGCVSGQIRSRVPVSRKHGGNEPKAMGRKQINIPRVMSSE